MTSATSPYLISLLLLLFTFTKAITKPAYAIVSFVLFVFVYVYASELAYVELKTPYILFLLLFTAASILNFNDFKRSAALYLFYLFPLVLFHLKSVDIFTYSMTTIAIFAFDYLEDSARENVKLHYYKGLIPIFLFMFFCSFFIMSTESTSLNVFHVVSPQLFFLSYAFSLMSWIFWFYIQLKRLRGERPLGFAKMVILPAFIFSSIKQGELLWFEIDPKFTMILFTVVGIVFGLYLAIKLLGTFNSKESRVKIFLIFEFQLFCLFFTQFLDISFLDSDLIYRNIIVLSLGYYILRNGLGWSSSSYTEKLLKGFIFLSFIGLPLVLFSASYEIILIGLIKNEMLYLVPFFIPLIILYLIYAIKLLDSSEPNSLGQSFPYKELLASCVIISTYYL